jgi:CRISPR type I-E-associated protein CasB/Cse2
MSKPNEKEASFVKRLEALVAKENRGALAALRRGLGKPPGAAAEMYPILEPWLSKDSAVWRDDPYYTVAALFAFWHQGKTSPARVASGNFGASMRLQGFEDGQWKEERFKSVERRFVALLNCRRDDLHAHLRHAVGLLKSKEIPVDWAQLLADIRGWNWDSRSVQRAWAKAFWASEPEQDAPAIGDDQTGRDFAEAH